MRFARCHGDIPKSWVETTQIHPPLTAVFRPHVAVSRLPVAESGSRVAGSRVRRENRPPRGARHVNRAASGRPARCVRCLAVWCDENRRPAGIVSTALDLPSGLNADTGEAAQGAVRADWTVTFHARKQGQDAPGAEAFCGEIEVADIGINAVLEK